MKLPQPENTKPMKHPASLILPATLWSALATGLMADYPIASQRYLADPTPLVTKDRVYIYCSNDDESPLEGSYNIPNVICVSSADMKNWTDHGCVFRAEDATTWAKKTWAPAAIERDGKFFLYFGNGGANIGVAVADKPTGPFKDPLGKPLITHGTPGVQPAKDMWLFDPGVFIDDDGQAYIYFGGNGDDNVRVAKLNRDMISLDGDVIKMNAPHFFEAAWVFKHRGTYYFSYSTTPRAQMRIDYMTGKHPIEGFQYKGIVSSQPPLNDHNNNHSAQFAFKDRWYHVYHNRIVAREAGIPTGFRRNLGLEEMHFEEDGSIRQVEFTPDGVKQIAAINPYTKVEAETFRAQKGVKTEPCGEGGMCLKDLRDGSWVHITGVDFADKTPKKFNARVSGGAASCQIEVRAGSPDGTLLARCDVPAAADPSEWRNLSAAVSGASGKTELFLVFKGGEDESFRMDCWKFD
jgi:arabinoxylan arabinofuranohydrolase